jgi:hypothetical protein
VSPAHGADADEAVLRERDKADADVRELQQRLTAARKELAQERAERQRVVSELARLKGRWSIRVALTLVEAGRPALQPQRRLRSRLATLRGRWRGAVSSRSAGPRRGGDPFVAEAEALVGRDAVKSLGLAAPECSPTAAVPGAQTRGDSATATGALVSIIMVVGDARAAVEPSIRSVRHQTYGQWELLVRDCTDDHRLELSAEERDARVGLARLRSTNEGVARHHGLAAARGELIAYLDPPNLWHPRFLETLIAALGENPTRYAVFSDHFAAGLAGRGWPVRQPDAGADYAELVAQGAVVLNAVLHRRELYDEIGAATNPRCVGADEDLLVKYAFPREPSRVDSPLLLQQATAHQGGSQAGVDTASDAVLLRACAEDHFQHRLPQRAGIQRPGMTVVGGVTEFAFEKAWDLAAAATEARWTQLISFRFGDVPTYGPRFLPAAETETLRLDGGRFPQWASMLARGVANARGDVVYAAEPRLPSLGLALLASFHHGSRVIADVSRPPLVQSHGDKPRPADEEPLGFDEVDPAEAALLDPHSAVWDRLMAGITHTLGWTASGAVVPAGEIAPGSLVMPHPKDEAVFDPESYDRDAARSRLELSSTHRVILWGGPDAVGAEAGQRSSLLETLAARFRVLALSSGPVRKPGVESGYQLVDRSDEHAVTTAVAASDAVLLWLDPHTRLHHRALPPELGSALAMQVPVIANDVGELGVLGRRGYLQLAAFGDVDGLARCLDGLADRDQRRAQVTAGRHLFMRRFSHAAARVNMAVTLRLVERCGHARQPVEDFARFVSAFYRHMGEASRSSR